MHEPKPDPRRVPVNAASGALSGDEVGASGPASALQRRPAEAMPRVLRLHTHDIDQQAEMLQEWKQTYVQLSPGRFEGRIVETCFGDIQFFREITDQAIHERGCSQPGTRTFCLPLDMEGSAYFRGIEWRHDAFATLGGGVEIDLRTGGRLDVIAVSFRVERLAEAALEHGLEPADVTRWLSSMSSTARLSESHVEELRRMLLELAMLVDAQSQLLRNPGVCLSIESAIYDAFVRLLRADAVDVRRPHGSYLPRRQVVRRAIDYVAAHPDGLVTVSDLCKLLHVSRRTLQQYFDDVLHVSPFQYLRAFRLNKVRSLILSGGGKLPIQEAAATWGFWHMSQFASDYKRLFGERPSQTSSRARWHE